MSMEHGMLLVFVSALVVIFRAKGRSARKNAGTNQVLNPPAVREMRKQTQFDLYVDLGYYK